MPTLRPVVTWFCIAVGLARCCAASSVAVDAPHDLAAFLWTAKPGQSQEMDDRLAALPLEKYSALLAEAYRSERANPEGASVLMGIVLDAHTKRSSPEETRDRVLKMLSDQTLPIELKQELLRSVEGWAVGEVGGTLNGLNAIRPSDTGLWVCAQYAISRLLTKNYGESRRNPARQGKASALKELARSHASEALPGLVNQSRDEDLFDRFGGKALSNYHRILGADFTQEMVGSLAKSHLEPHAQLRILRVTSGWSENVDVADYVEHLVTEASRSGRDLSGSDRALADDIVKAHRSSSANPSPPPSRP